MLSLCVRYYRCHPPEGEEYDESRFGHVHRTLELDPEHTAFVTVDLWNMGWEPEPLDPELGRYAEYHFVGLGRRACAEARRVVEENLAPALRAARQAGLTVIHSNSRRIVERYPECACVAEEPAAQAPPPAEWPPAELGQAVMREYFEATWGEGANESWERMRALADFPDPVKPVPGDFCVYQQAAVNQILRQRRITTVIHAGFLLGHCLLDKPGGIRGISGIWRRPGYRDILLRDCTVAQESHESIESFGTTRAFLFWLEATGVPTATSADFVGACSPPERAR